MKYLIGLIPGFIFVVAFFFMYPHEQEAEKTDNKEAMKGWTVALWLVVILVVILETMIGSM